MSNLKKRSLRLKALAIALGASLIVPAVPRTTSRAEAVAGEVSGQIYTSNDMKGANNVLRYVALATDADPKTRQITWTVIFNKANERWGSQLLHVFLPSQIDENTIVINRRYGSGGNWTPQESAVYPTTTASGTRFDEGPHIPKWMDEWNGRFFNEFKDNNYNPEFVPTVQGWLDDGKMGVHFYSQEGGGSNMFEWTITATYDEDVVDPYDLPIVVGESNSVGKYPYFIVQGPFNSDHHNLSDVLEGYYGLDANVEDKLSDYIDPSTQFTSDDDKVGIKDRSSLNEMEKAAVVEAAKRAAGRAIDANSRFNADQKAHILSGLSVAVADNGDVTITYPDYNSDEAISVDTLSVDDYAKERTQSYAPSFDETNTSASKKITGTGLPGSSVTVTDASGAVIGTATVDNEGKWSVPAGRPLQEGEVLRATQTESGGNMSTSEEVSTNVGTPITDSTAPVVPGTKTEVSDPTNLTEDEKSAVEKAVKDANADTFPDGTTVTVGNDGTVTITYPDDSTDTIGGSEVVTKKAGREDTGTSGTNADAITPAVPGTKTEVSDPTNLTDDEKSAVEKAVKDANADTFPDGTTVTVGNDGTVTITYPDNSTDTIGGSEVVTKKAGGEDTGTSGTNADAITPVVPGTKTEVSDPSNLTEDEKSAVEKAVKDANGDTFPEGTTVTVGNDGTVTITYPDGSKDKIGGSEVVSRRETSEAAKVTPVASNDTTVTGRGVPGAEVTVTLPGGESVKTTVGTDGNWSVDLPSGTELSDEETLTVTQKESDREGASTAVTVTVGASTADAITPVVPGTKTEVSDPSNLTEDEKSAVEKAVKDANVDTFPEGTTVTVGDDGTVTNTYPDGSKDTIGGSKVVTRRETSKEPAVNPVTSVDKTVSGTGVPGAVVTVTLPGGKEETATVDTDGTWSVSLPEGTSLSKDNALTVSQKEADRANPSSDVTVTVGASKADTITPAVPGTKTEVSDPSNLTEDEKSAVEKTVKDANKDTFPEGTTVSVGDDGMVTITYPDKSVDTISGSDVVKAKETGEEPTGKTTADTITPVVPGTKTEATDPTKLTEDEKAAVAEAVKEANKDTFPEGTTVTVGDDGTVTITYPDKSVDTIVGSDVVKAKRAVNHSTDNNTEKDTKAADKSPKKSGNAPQTGDHTSAGLPVATGLAAIGAAFVALFRKKRL